MLTADAEYSVVGFTRHYAPPEQIMRKGADARSDLYSLSATLYHLITGVIPPDVTERLAALKENRPDPLVTNEQNRLLPASIASVLFRSMAINIHERPSSAAQMRKMLKDGSQTALKSDLGRATTVPMSDSLSKSFDNQEGTTEAQTVQPRVPSTESNPRSISPQTIAGAPPSMVLPAKSGPRLRMILSALIFLFIVASLGIGALYFMSNSDRINRARAQEAQDLGVASSMGPAKPQLTNQPSDYSNRSTQGGEGEKSPYNTFSQVGRDSQGGAVKISEAQQQPIITTEAPYSPHQPITVGEPSPPMDSTYVQLTRGVEWRVASVESLPDKTRVKLEIKNTNNGGAENVFYAFNTAP